VVSTFTSKYPARSKAAEPHESGFTLIELVLGLSLAVILALAVAPLWMSLQGGSAREGDQTLRFLQGRVAASRFERDLRLASAADCPFPLTAPIVEATGSRVVFVTRPVNGVDSIMVEWEIVRGSLMRRWGPCPSTRMVALAGSVYRDNKTMLEGVRSESSFSYVVDGTSLVAPSSEADLAAIEKVVLDLRAGSTGARSAVRVVSEARVGR
jgi:prepilin-type N-terminal cleavage/methylation domain-containing protein